MIRIDPSAFDTIYKLYGKHIYPAFILPNTTLGITEIEAVRASRDYKETGGVNPNIRSLIAYNTDSKITKTVRSNGVLIAQVTPRGGLVSGQSSIMHLDGDNWEDAVIRNNDGRFGKELWSSNALGEKISVSGFWETKEEATFVSDQIEK